jgi:hypothetical protein
MVKAKKFLRKQAEKAELMARRSSDVELALSYANLARAYRSQADSLKTKKKRQNKKPSSEASAENHARSNARDGHW